MENGKPRFRVIWGANRTRSTDDGIIYFPYEKNRWHLEKLLKGEYEHSYKFAQCPHSRGRWCNVCFKTGGEFLPLTLAVVETAIRLILKAENLQNAALQKAALVEREQKKIAEHNEEIAAVIADARPREVRRSFDPKLRITAPFGRGKTKQISGRKYGVN